MPRPELLPSLYWSRGAVGVVVHGQHFLVQPGVEQFARLVHEQVDHGAGFGVVQVFLDQFGAAAGVHQVVEADARHFKVAQQLEQLGHLALVALVDGEAQAHLQPFGLAILDAFQRAAERAGHGAEPVVHLFAAVQRNADVGQAHFLQFAGLLLGDQGAVGGDDRPHAARGGVLGQFHQVLAHQRFAAGKEHHRRAVGGEIVDDGLALFGGDFVLAVGVDGLGVTVHALQIATAGHVPDHHRFLVLGELEQVGGKLARMAPVAKGVGGLDLTTVKLGDADHSHSCWLAAGRAGKREAPAFWHGA